MIETQAPPPPTDASGTIPKTIPDENIPASGSTMDQQLPVTPEQVVLLHQGLSPVANDMVHAYDRDWVQAMVKLNIDFAKIPSGTDVEAMRNWIRDDYSKIDQTPRCKPFRSVVSVETTDVEVKYGENESFRIRIYDPQDKSSGDRPAVLMYHGGGWIHGSPENDEEMSKFLASDLRAVVFGIAYRHAPEHNIHTLHNDSYEALEWVLSHSVDHRVDSNSVALWGASAGAHLAAGVAVRDAQEHTPSRICQVNLVVPVTCHIDAIDGILGETLMMKKMEMEKMVGLPLTVDMMVAEFRKLFSFITGDSISPTHPLVSPLRYPSPFPINHAPVHITVAGCDLLADQGIAYHRMLRDAEIDSTLEILPGVPHGFTWVAGAQVTKQWTRQQTRVLDTAFRGIGKQ